MPNGAGGRSFQYLVSDVRRHNPWWDPPGDAPGSARQYIDAPTVRKGDFYYFIRHYEDREPVSDRSDDDDGDGEGEGEGVDDDRVFALAGRRGVGKTTLVYQFLDHHVGAEAHPRQFLYLPFGEDPMYQLRAADQLRQAVNYYESRILPTVDADEHYLLLDDVHTIGEKPGERSWATEVESLLSERPGRRVVLTGVTDHQLTEPLSQVGVDPRVQPVLPEKFRDYLFRRYRAATGVDDISFQKYRIQFDDRGSLPAALASGDPEPFVENLQTLYEQGEPFETRAKASLDRYLAYGGVLCLRSASEEGNLDRSDVREYLNDVRLSVYQEVPGIERVSNVGDLDRLLSFAAREGPTDPFRYDTLTDLFGIDRRTLRGSYFRPLERLFLLTRACEYDNQRPRSVRLFVRDTGIANALTRTTLSDVRQDIDREAELALTAAFDHTVRLEYGFHQGARNLFDDVGPYNGPSVGYRQTDAGTVDFVFEVDHPGGPTPVPVGFAYRPDSVTNVKQAVSAFRSNFDAPVGFVVASDLAAGRDSLSHLGDGLVQLPYWFYLVMS
jgi:predicted AAA+ superfamily ATPase